MRIVTLFLVLLSTVLALSGCQTRPNAVVIIPADTKVIVVTRAPAPKEVVVVPRGHYRCFKVEAGWYNNVWVPTHKVCKYRHAQQGKQMWVAGYWQCDSINANACTNWTWVSGHWSDLKVVY